MRQENTVGNFGINTLTVILKLDAHPVAYPLNKDAYFGCLAGLAGLQSIEDKI